MSIFRKPTLLLAVLFFLSLNAAYAQDGEEFWYKVEVLVFSNVTIDAYDSEKWPVDEQPLLPINSVALKPEPIMPPVADDMSDGQITLPPPFTELGEKMRDFHQIPSRMEKDARYEILLHHTWAQPVYKGRSGVPVLLDDEQSINAYQAFSVNTLTESSVEEESELNEELAVENLQSESDVIDVIIVPEDEISLDWTDELLTSSEAPLELNTRLRQITGPEELRVYGTVTLKMSRFLHLNIDMYFRTERPKIETPPGLLAADFPMEGEEKDAKVEEAEKNEFLTSLELEPIDFHLQESQRIKTKQIYYFDHPLFGVIAMVTPIEMPEPEELPMAP